MSKKVISGSEDAELFDRVEMFMIWQGLSAKRTGVDAMMWQTPALAMFAQAFLLTLALQSGTDRWARLVASVLSLVLSLMSMQLMAKHRRHELLQSHLLERVEKRVGMDRMIGVLPHGVPHAQDIAEVERQLARSTPWARWFWRASSYELWMAGLALFAIAAVFVVVIVAAGATAGIVS